jgi:transcriptional regulator with XRE-family HTH domain
MKVQSLNHFRTNLRALMAEREFTQRSIAEKAETSYAYINRVLTGKAHPALDFCDRIADALGVPLTDMLGKPKDASDGKSKNGVRNLRAKRS